MKTILFLICAAALSTGPCSAWAADTNQPLPTLEEIFNRVVERARKERDNDRAFATNYVFIRTKTTEYRNSKGEVKKQEAKVRTNDPAAIIAAAAQPQPTRQKPRNRTSDKPVSDTHSNVRGKAFEEDEFALNGDLVKRFDFKLAGRETWNGRPALVVEFQPKQGKVLERNLKEKFINKAAGRVWIDEGDYALARADLWLTERVNVIGGLVGAVWKFKFGFEREWLEDGLWFTRKSNWHLEGREVFIHRTVDYHEERTDVRKFGADLTASTTASGE